MSGDDRRTALPGRIEKIRELIASFFRAFTHKVHQACLRTDRTAPYGTSRYQPAAGDPRNFCGALLLILLHPSRLGQGWRERVVGVEDANEIERQARQGFIEKLQSFPDQFGDTQDR